MHSHYQRRGRIFWVFLLLCGAPAFAPAQNLIFVDGTTCTLPKAIGLANYANFVYAGAIGSATTDFTGCTTLPPPQPPSFLPPVGSYTLYVTTPTIALTTIDNYWYGPNALPPIACSIVIQPTAGALTLTASHTGDPTPATANAFRFFYVSGGLELPAGSLTLAETVLQGGYAKGGDAGTGGGGAGMGGAIFNQGTLVLDHVSLLDNTAKGGDSGFTDSGGGGMGQDATAIYLRGGAFGPTPYWPLASAFGGSGGGGFLSGGGGGGFRSADGGVGATASGGSGGGLGSLGGNGGTSAGVTVGGVGGDGGGGGSGNDILNGLAAVGGNFGGGGDHGYPGGGGGGGGGIGGGGGYGYDAGGGGGFGGGGGGASGDEQRCPFAGSGGFGGGGGSFEQCGNGGPAAPGGFGAGSATSYYAGGGGAGGGAGMGGAIFNHRGSVALLNVTATGNAVVGGTSLCATCGGSGLGAVLFNLNGTVTIDFSTFAGNLVSGNNGRADNFGPEDGSVYSLAFGNKIEDGSASSATLTIHNSIIHGTHADAGQHSDVSVNVVNGTHSNSSSLNYAGKNFIGQSYTVIGTTQSGTSPNTADPLLGSLSIYSASPLPLPVLPIGANSPAYNTASSCLDVNAAPVATDARGAARPYATLCDVGAYEFDGDYIFADGIDVRL